MFRCTDVGLFDVGGVREVVGGRLYILGFRFSGRVVLWREFLFLGWRMDGEGFVFGGNFCFVLGVGGRLCCF